MCHCLPVPDADLCLLNVESPLLPPGVCAIGITDGRFTHFWSNKRDASARSTIDVSHRSVVPGIDDSHLHGYEYGRSLTALDVGRSTAPNLEALQSVLRHAKPESSGWIRGIGWDSTDFVGSGPDGTLSAQDIDEFTGSTPAILTDVTGHQALVNSAALVVSGIDTNTPDTPGGVFARDASGRPTGLLLEAAVGRVNRAIPQLSRVEQQEAILIAQKDLVRQGIVAFTDPGLGPGARTLMDGTGDLRAIEAYQSLDADGLLKLRVNVMLLFGGLGGTTVLDVSEGLAAFGSPLPMTPFGRLGIAQLKVFADGIPRSRTAWMADPYDDCSHGKLQIAGDSDAERVHELHTIVRSGASRGFQVGIHAIGDLAIRHVVDALSAPGNASDALRHYVIHGDFVGNADIERMARASVTLNANPSIRWQVGGSVSAILGEERNARRQPLRTAVDSGVNVCLSSDAPVAPPDWRVIVAAAVTRSWRSHPSRTDGQRLSVHEALLALSRNAAWQSRAEDWRGSFAVGQAADLVVLADRVDWNDPWSLTEVAIARTIIQGETVFGD